MDTQPFLCATQAQLVRAPAYKISLFKKHIQAANSSLSVKPSLPQLCLKEFEDFFLCSSGSSKIFIN